MISSITLVVEKIQAMNIPVNVLARYEIQVDRTMCIACGTCYGLNPDHFEPGQEEKSMVIGGETDENSSSGAFEDEEIERAKEAEESCPVSAITVTEK